MADTNTPLPGCCGPWLPDWPWPQPLAGAHWMGLRFQRERFMPEPWAGGPVEPPDSVRGAAPKRQLEYLAGRLCAHAALHRLTGRATVPGSTPSRAPAWPAGVVGSITHSGDLAASIVARRSAWRGLGLDAELPMNPERAERLAAQILTPGERERLTAMDPADRGIFVTQVFSLKESLFKALFPLVGVRFYFQDARLVARDEAMTTATLELLASLSPDWPAGTYLTGQVGRLGDHLLSLITIPA
ncbi:MULTISPECIES: 4'-phosphopantetheinyl transferase superfamily protein [unclassified Modicisalibacter]|uniref:4'-phosphopantetheinyl transferase family protein n=1 Tax=unclassified Modicisalibacter TaxID=2679913 RepID=UPI001CCA63EA|nr:MULTISPECIES: 4'-phosphopantetheinyl transferase superfamily protein [unclassified Modicisalibacter]MBZ9558041.1 4'-phosphopantetheinyl transferase superfamily protein [Modicisalibacter sp. R2A 31.J]MBZ9573291.1 4'-phosphopantetheinyl transferase superfamily protein [Modicisalibacter sp. MOD 31.J]